ncbi:hypothetical protein [Spirosoma arcticum]
MTRLARPGLRWLVILTLLFTLAQGYYAYVSTGPLRFNSTQISHFFVFFGATSALTNFVFFKYFLDKVDKKKIVISMAIIGAGLHVVYANVGQLVWLLYATAAVDSLTVALLGGVLNGLVAQQTSDVRLRFYWFALSLTALAVLAFRIQSQIQEDPATDEDPSLDDIRPDAAGPAEMADPGGTTA